LDARIETLEAQRESQGAFFVGRLRRAVSGSLAPSSVSGQYQGCLRIKLAAQTLWWRIERKPMKTVTLYKPNGETHGSFSDVSAVETTNGILRFRHEREVGDRSSMQAIETSLPFILTDDLGR
jgi:hypothetical protein